VSDVSYAKQTYMSVANRVQYFEYYPDEPGSPLDSDEVWRILDCVWVIIVDQRVLRFFVSPHPSSSDFTGMLGFVEIGDMLCTE